MARELFIPRNFKAEALALIETSNNILETYKANGIRMTLRQLYYQLVSRNIIPNSQKSYNNLGNMINAARLAGMVDWNHITDTTRNLRSIGGWDSPAQVIRTYSHVFHKDRWETQDFRPEVWIEKDALVSVFTPVCNELDVPLFSCRGYTSQSEMYSAAKRLQMYADEGKQAVILHFGDHDPSGIDMSRDIRERLEMFGVVPEFSRQALNMAQIEQYTPPPNPAKITDSRSAAYIRQFGNESYELDALEPVVLQQLVRTEILTLVRADDWEATEEEERRGRTQLQRISRHYDALIGYMDSTLDVEGDE